MKMIGYIFGETRIDELTFLAKEPPKIGDYALIKYDNYNVLGMIENTLYGSEALKDIFDVNHLEKLKEFIDDNYYIIGKIKVLGDINNFKLPRIPPKPGTEVYLADINILKKVFGDGHIRIGTLVTREDVEVKLDANKLCSRHLAILAMTGMGKSNTVAVLVKELKKLNATVLIFDMHGEFKNMKCNSLNLDINVIQPKINIYQIAEEDFCDLAGVDKQATKQRPYIMKALDEVKKSKKEKDFTNASEFIDEVINVLKSYLEEGKDESSIQTAIFRLENLKKFKEKIITINYNPVEKIKENTINVLPLEELDENDADVVISYISKQILDNRKKIIYEEGKDNAKPIFLIFEEAHLIVPKDRNTRAKYYLGRIAREGRKFGVGLGLVSQRPKGLDPNVLSQCSNLIISKLIEPSDQKHVQYSSEALSEDLMKQLTSLNIGEAIILGPCIKIPAIVKIDKFDGEYKGEDIDLVELWNKVKEDKELKNNTFENEAFG